MASFSHSQIHNLLLSCDGIISFAPFSHEPDVTSLFEQKMPVVYMVPQHKTLDPFLIADTLKEKHRNTTLVIFCPGRVFDSTGTRHGRGGGWYDRFLSRTPKHWIRVGVLFESQLSPTPLIRQAWDEPMDYLFIQHETDWILNTLHRQ